jgi:hypothetical protein
MASTGFLNDLISLLDPNVVAGLIEAALPKVVESSNYTDPGFLADLISNQAMLSHVIGLIDVQVLANVINANPDMTADLMPLLDPSVGAGLAAGISSNPALLVEMLNALNPAIVVNALNAHPEITEELSRLMPASLGKDIAKGLGQNPAFIGELLKHLDPAPIAAALASNTGLIYDLITGIKPSLVRPMIEGSNQNPDFLAALIGALNPAAVAGALNANPDFVKTLLTDLGGPLGAAQARGLRDNWLRGNDFLPALISALDPAVVAGAVNANPDFLKGFLGATSPSAARYIAEGINLNVATHPFGQDLLSALITNISPAAAATLAQGVNANVAANPTDNLLTGLLANTSGPAGVAIAIGLNNNPAFIRVLVENVSPDTAIAAAQGINLSCQKAASDSDYAFLRSMLANLGPGAALAGAEGLDNNPQKEALLTAIINNLNAGAVAPLIAAGVNSNAAAQSMIPAVMQQLSPATAQTMALAMNANPEMTSWLLQELEPSTVTGLLFDNSDVIIDLIGNMDGSVIAEAVNAEYDMHPGSSLIERMIPTMSGAEIADLLSEFGYEFLVELMANLDGGMVARALNNAGQDFLSELIAFFDPDLFIDMLDAEGVPDFYGGSAGMGGSIKNLNISIFIYMTDLGIGLGGAAFKTLYADTYMTYDPIEAGLDEIPPFPFPWSPYPWE